MILSPIILEKFIQFYTLKIINVIFFFLISNIKKKLFSLSTSYFFRA